MTMRQLGVAAIAILVFGASASLAKNKAEPAPARPPTAAEANRILAFARETRQAKGCEAALADYRVIAAMGEGFEAAQDELGECLLEAPGASAIETTLRREEALFWLRRAAYAGNARAQRALAELYAGPKNPEHSDLEALKWALLYEANPDASLYGYKDFPRTFVPGLKGVLSPEAVEEAQAFVKNFTPVRLALYQGPPRREAGQRGEERRALGAEGPYGGPRPRGPGRPGGEGPGGESPGGDGDEGGQPY
ncbi:MAG: hypothetical protein GC153_06215 [Alphaproteobacteria bacterium]|nr:hypothetical protein [Alphaproteobacteria bacterium]